MAAQTKAVEGKVTSKGQLTLPASVRRSIGIKPGDRLRFEITGPDTMTVRVRKKHDVFDLLKALPPLVSSKPLDRNAIAEATDAALGEKFAAFGRSDR